MNKLWLIIKREYLTRVTKKMFLLATLGTPIAIALFLAAEVWIIGYESESNRIAVVDNAQLVKGTGKALKDSKTVKFFVRNESLDELKEKYLDLNYNGVLYLPENLTTSKKKDVKVEYYSEDKLGIVSKEYIEKIVAKRVEDQRVTKSGYDRKVLDGFDTNVEMKQKTTKAGADDEKSFSAEIATFIGLLIGYVMFFVVMIYGSMVMRSVMEEKTSRIVEVIISSVKPFQLMLGKIIGVGMVGLTQLGIWAVLIPAIVMGASFFLQGAIDPSAVEDFGGMGGDFDQESTQEYILKALEEMRALNWWSIIPISLAFFLGGYFLYSSLFAALGSAAGDDAAEAQTLTVPISMLLVVGFLLMIAAIRNPNSGLALWSSLVPFFSPILMPARLAFNPPWWEIALSLVLLIAASLFFVWLSARIYRIGILMYGKKASVKEIAKWLFYKE